MPGASRDAASTEQPDASAPTVADLLPAYLDQLAADGRAEHTIASSRLDLLQLERFLGKQRIDAVTLDDLTAFFVWLSRQQGNGAASLRRKTATTKHFFRYLRARGIAGDDPSAGLVYPTIDRDEPAPLTSAQAEAVVAAATTTPWRALLLCLLDAGLKRDEVVALRWADLELSPPDGHPACLHVRHRRAAKQVRQRTLALTPRLVRALTDLADETGHTPGAEDGLVFGIGARGVDYVVEMCGQRAGVDAAGTITPQMLRDAFACARMTNFILSEGVRQRNPKRVPQLRREHDRRLLRELGLSDHSAAADRYRRLVGRLQANRPKQLRLDDL